MAVQKATASSTGSLHTHEVTLKGLTATPSSDLRPSGDGTNQAVVFHVIEIDCTANAAEDVWVRVWDTTTPPTNGTTAAMLSLKGYKGEKKTYQFVGGNPKTGSKVGPKANVNFHAAAQQEAGGSGGATDPTGTVDVKFLLSEQ